jgi:myo-inositol 2-dehydrogenase/D-chiro-inositol 1-dehydrogenase
MKRLTLGIIGAGRIGKLHAENLLNFNNVHLKMISDLYTDPIKDWVHEMGIPILTNNYEEILADDSIDAVLICSPTNTHAEIIYKAVEAGKHIFCEKPITFSLEESQKIASLVNSNLVKFQVGFNRRFDQNFQTVQQQVISGEIGDVHIIKITSRDPKPPHHEYIKGSGGLFIDMSIHDFDMLRYLSNSEVEEIYVNGACLVDPIFEEFGDIDTAVITVKFKNGTLGIIDNSRQAVYGYDQRIEVFGSKGVLQAENVLGSTVKKSTVNGSFVENPKYFFLERYKEAYINEMRSFVNAIQNNEDISCNVNDGLEAERIAYAAKRSLESGQTIKLINVFAKVN